jgi:hypothetical protein
MADQAMGMAARLAGLEVPGYADTETSVAELKARIARTIDFIKSIKPADIDGRATREIVINAGGNDYRYPGSVLRHCGVELKRDFLGAREPPH